MITPVSRPLYTEDPVRVAVVGAGSMGRNHVRVYSTLKDVELIGILDTDVPRARVLARQYGCRLLSSIDEVAQEADAVSVAVPSVLHAEKAGLLLEQSVHCLVEKPLAVSASECHALIDAARTRDLVLMVGHVERFNPVVTQLAQITAGATIHALDARRMSSLSSRIVDVDVTTDLMVHDIDIALAIVPAEVISVSAQGVRTRGGRGEDYVVATLAFDDGAIASLIASRITHNKIRELRVTTDVDFLSADYSSQELLIYRQGQVSPLRTETSEANYVLDLAIERVLIRAQEPLVLELRNFTDAVRGRSVPRVTGEDALKALEIVWEIQNQIALPAAAHG